MSDFINDSLTPPVISGRRISVIDVMAALESPDPESQLYDSWDLSEAQVEAAKDYVEAHEEEIRKMEEEMREAQDDG